MFTQYSEQTHRHVYTEIQQVFGKNKLTLGETNL